MALNSNHTFEEVNEIKCSIVEKNCTPERVNFLQKLLEHNSFTVVVAKSPVPKVTVKPELEEHIAETLPPEKFTIGVTDLSFNVANAIFNRELKTPDNKLVTPNYWKQIDNIKNEEGWYWKK